MQKNWRVLLPLIGFGIIGLGLLGFGLKEILFPKAPKLELIQAEVSNSPEPTKTPTIYVDVAGAVEKPGVYSLPLGARVSDALIEAGGLAPSADKNYVARHINLASVLIDGSKIYILRKGESPDVLGSTITTTITPTSPNQSSKVNINTATVSELDTLPGIGEARASSIINGRPYTSLEEIKTKANISDSVYETIKDDLTL